MTAMTPTLGKEQSTPMASMASNKDQQRAYTRELMAMGAAGVFSGVVASGLALIAGGHAAPLALLSFGALMGLSASLLEHRSSRSNLKLLLGVIAGIGMAMMVGVNALVATALGGVLLGVVMTMDAEARPLERGALVLAHGLALAAGLFTSSTLMGVGFLSDFAHIPLLGGVLQASIWALFLMLPAGLKHMQWRDDEGLAELRAAMVGLDQRHQNTLKVAQETYGQILDEIEREASQGIQSRSRQLAEEVLRGLVALTVRSNELHQAIVRTNARPLEVRARELEERIRATRDAALRHELVAALGEVVEQMRARRRLETACARIEARQQRYLTALDKLHVTLVQNDSLSSTEGALVHSLDELSRLTEEVRWQNLSVEELIDSGDVDDALSDDDMMVEEDGAFNELLDEVAALSSSSPLRDATLPRVTLPPVRRSSTPPSAASTGASGVVLGTASVEERVRFDDPSPSEEESEDAPVPAHHVQHQG